MAALVHLWFDSVGSNANMLLNFPPDTTGHLRETDVNRAIEAHNIISSARANNLALGASVSADCETLPEYPAENLVTPGDNITVATALCPTYTLKLTSSATFNMFEIGEAIEYGHRVRGFKIEALVEGEWKTLYDGECIGYKWAEYFDEVTTDTVRVSVYDAVAAPLLRSFGLYLLDTSVFEEEKRIKHAMSGKNLAEGKSARVNYSEREVEVEFGGVYPFNTVSFNSLGGWKYEIYAFDGSNYQLIFTGHKAGKEQVVRLPETVKTSYKMKLVSTSPINPKTVNICVTEIQ